MATEVWLCSGIEKPYRIASWHETYGEFDSVEDAQEFKRLLLEGNEDLIERTYREAVWEVR